MSYTATAKMLTYMVATQVQVIASWLLSCHGFAPLSIINFLQKN